AEFPTARLLAEELTDVLAAFVCPLPVVACATFSELTESLAPGEEKPQTRIPTEAMTMSKVASVSNRFVELSVIVQTRRRLKLPRERFLHGGILAAGGSSAPIDGQHSPDPLAIADENPDRMPCRPIGQPAFQKGPILDAKPHP